MNFMRTGFPTNHRGTATEPTEHWGKLALCIDMIIKFTRIHHFWAKPARQCSFCTIGLFVLTQL